MTAVCYGSLNTARPLLAMSTCYIPVHADHHVGNLCCTSMRHITAREKLCCATVLTDAFSPAWSTASRDLAHAHLYTALARCLLCLSQQLSLRSVTRSRWGSRSTAPRRAPACQGPREPAEHVPSPSLYPICTVSQHHTSSCSASDAAHAFSSKSTAALATCLTGEAALTHFSTLDTPQMAFDATGNREEQAPTVARWWAKHSRSLGIEGA